MGEITREFVGLPSPAIGRAGAGGHPCQGIYHYPAGKATRAASTRRSPRPDKRFELIEADHYLLEPASARGQAADLIASWVASRG